MSNNKKKRKLYVFRAKERKKEKKLIYQDNLTLSQSTKSTKMCTLKIAAIMQYTNLSCMVFANCKH